jgi:hypothetical protein
VSADAYLSKFANEDPSLHGSREGDLLKEMISACKENNALKFRSAITKYNDINQMDTWKINMFNRILEKIDKEVNVADDGDYR